MNNNYLLSAFTYGKIAVGRCLPFFLSPVRPLLSTYAGSVSVDSDRFRSFQFSALRFIRFPAFFSGRKVEKKMLFPEKKYFNIAFVWHPFEVSPAPPQSPNIWTWCHLCRKRGEGDDKNFPFAPQPHRTFLALSNCAGAECPFLLNIYRPNKMKSI